MLQSDTRYLNEVSPTVSDLIDFLRQLSLNDIRCRAHPKIV